MNNQYTQEDECFVATQIQQHTRIQQNNNQQIVNLDIRSSLPQANQLINYTRPTQMLTRIMATQGMIQYLPDVLNQQCQQIIVQASNANIKAKLNNKDKLTLSQYLLRKQMYTIFTKQQPTNNTHNINNLQYKKSINQITFRLRVVSQTSDYNSKQFKQLIKYQQNLGISNNISNVEGKIQQDLNKISQKYQDKIDSNFQCGNMAKAYGHIQSYRAYYLLLQQDTNTHGYTNWFFYRVKNIGVGIRKFYILNLVKQTNFYRQGMKISIFSLKKNKQLNIKWFKGGDNISFFQTNFLRQEHNDYFNCLYFQYNFLYQNDQVYFAASQPYTYTRVANLFKTIKQQNDNTLVNWKIQIVGYSIANNIIPAVTFYLKNQPMDNKKTIVIIGRQHPSQVAGSFISEYLIKKFIEERQQATFLLKKYNVLFIPMVNPDGVIYGNSRSNLNGFDLNRHWGVDAIKQLTPQTHKIRTLLSQLQKNNSNNIKFLLDLHGHGKKLNSFLFCCKKQDRISNRYFPLIISKIQQRFDLISCTYGITRDKQNTIRAQLYDIGINDCYTLQNSCFGYYKNKEQGQIVSYNEKDYKNIAQSINKSLYIFLTNQKNDKEKIKQKYGFNLDTINEQLMKIVDRLQRQQKNIVYDQDIMSQSDPEGDGLKLEERLKICTNNKILDKKIRQSFKKNKVLSYDKNRNIKKYENCQKNPKIKTQPQQQKDDQYQEEDIKMLQQKIQTKLILSKKLRTQNKIRSSTRQRKSILETKKAVEDNQQKIVKKFLNKSFNPFQIPKQQPLQFSKSQYVPNSNKNTTNKKKPFQKCRIYQQLKTQIQQNHSFSALDIQIQNQRKQKIQGELIKLKQQNLKNVVKQSLLFIGPSIRGKKCKWADEKKYRNLASNHVIQAKFYTQNFNNQVIGKNNNLKQQKSEASFIKEKKIIRTTTQQSMNIKIKSQPKRRKPKRSYQRFQSFVQNIPIPSIRNLLNEKGSVFYHFPVM